MDKKIIITGFDSFGGEKLNPSYEAVKMLPETISGATIFKIELPTVFGKSIDALKKAMAEIKPDYVVCVGQSGGRFEITPERVAINVSDARIPDNEGQSPIDEPIFADGENAYFTKLPIKAMVKALKENNIPGAVSNTAGTYVCNHIMYGLLYLINTYEEFKDIKGGFIHVPYCTEQVIDKRNEPSLTREQISKGLEICIEALINNTEDIKEQNGAIC